MRIYLDNCTLNRPFDDQRQIRIRLEAEAKLYIQEQIRAGLLDMLWSYMLDFENSANPFQERRDAIARWRELSVEDIEEDQNVITKAKELSKAGLKAKDALHVACAIRGNAQYFLTTDDNILRKLSSYDDIKVMTPTEFVRFLGEET